MSDIASLLAQSRAAHARSLQYRGRVDKSGQILAKAQVQEAGPAIEDALRLRLEAHDLDPQHIHPAWSVDVVANKGVSHEALVIFMGRYLTPAEARTSISSISPQ